ncbi:MAG: hypothetical protein ACOYL7_13245 [Caldilinea sp.]
MTELRSHVLAEPPEVDLAVLQEAVGELEAYLVTGELYRTLRVQTPAGFQLVQMSAGDLLARLERLVCQQAGLSVSQQAALERAAAATQSIFYSLRTRFHELLQREIKARLDSLSWFLEDAAGDPRRARVEYPYEIRNRQRVRRMAEELAEELPPALKRQIERVDERIRLLVKPADFVWGEPLQACYPRQRDWYLYVSP